MATKTTSTTENNAGCSPCTPEAHQRADIQNQLKGKIMKLTKKHVQICISEGFSRAHIQTHDAYGNEDICLLADLDDEGEKTMIFEPSGRAWMLIGPAGMKSPKAITESWSGGNRPVYKFSNVRDAASLAKSGIYY